MAAAGLSIGWVGAFAGARLVSGLLFGIRPVDPATYAAITAALTLMTAVAAYIPAKKAARIDSAECLRTQ